MINFIKDISNIVQGLKACFGPDIANFATNVIKDIFSLKTSMKVKLEGIYKGIIIVSKIIKIVGKMCGVKIEDEDLGDIGFKAKKSDKSYEDFDSDIEEYIEYLKSKIEADKKEFENLRTEEKIECYVIGISLEVKIINKRLGIEMSPEFIKNLYKVALVNDVLITGEGLYYLLSEMKKNGIYNSDVIIDYFKGENFEDRSKIGDNLQKIFSSIPEIKNVDKYIWELKNIIRNDN